eukprot:COSAG01_NODE_903_length_12848_cov_7.966899_5_plen_239_part_00
MCADVNFVSGVRFSNVSFIDNFGGGIHLSLGSNLGNATMPIGVRFDNCRVNGTGYSGPLLAERTDTGGAEPNAVVISGVGPPFVNSGEIRFNNLSVANASGGVGLVLERIPAAGWAKLVVDGLYVHGVGFNSLESLFAPIDIRGSFDHGAIDRSVRNVPTGSIAIRNAVVHDASARPFLRVVDPFGFRGLSFNGTVVNPYGCSANAEAGIPLADLRLSEVPSSNLSIEVACHGEPALL